jgi:prevent-host-death family protein
MRGQASQKRPVPDNLAGIDSPAAAAIGSSGRTLTQCVSRVTFQSMNVIEVPIRDLHARTGHFVRLAARKQDIIVTERGKPAARLSSLETPGASPSATIAERRRVRPGYRAALAAGKLGGPDSTKALIETAAVRDL